MLFLVAGNNPMAIMKVMPIIMILFIGAFFAWFWAIAIGLQHKVPSEVKMKVKKFKVFFFIPLIYIVLLLGFMALVFFYDLVFPHWDLDYTT